MILSVIRFSVCLDLFIELSQFFLRHFRQGDQFIKMCEKNLFVYCGKTGQRQCVKLVFRDSGVLKCPPVGPAVRRYLRLPKEKNKFLLGNSCIEKERRILSVLFQFSMSYKNAPLHTCSTCPRTARPILLAR